MTHEGAQDRERAALFAEELTKILMKVLARMPKREREERLKKFNDQIEGKR